MPSERNRHIASLQHILNEIEEEERRYQGHVDPQSAPGWLGNLPNGQTADFDMAVRVWLKEYRQVNREHEITIENCRRTAHQLLSGVYSDREVVFLTERFRAVFARIRREHDWLDNLTRQLADRAQRHHPA